MSTLKYKEYEATVKEDLTQGDLEAFGDVFDLVEVGKVNIPRRNGTAFRAALTAGWLTIPNVTAEDVATIKPDVVRWFGNKMLDLYVEVTKIDPNF
jgi:hypothetical protein